MALAACALGGALTRAYPPGLMAKKAAKKARSKPAKRPTAARASAPKTKPTAKKPAAKQRASKEALPARPAPTTRAKAAVLKAPKPAARKPASKVPEIPGKPDLARAFAVEAARLLADDRCEDVRVLDVRGIYQECDYVVIGSGTSDRQLRSAGDHVVDLGEKTGHKLSRHEADDRNTWVLLDFVDVTVHLFEPNTRAYYDLEMRWGDAKPVTWARPGGKANPAVEN